MNPIVPIPRDLTRLNQSINSPTPFPEELQDLFAKIQVNLQELTHNLSFDLSRSGYDSFFGCYRRPLVSSMLERQIATRHFNLTIKKELDENDSSGKIGQVVIGVQRTDEHPLQELEKKELARHSFILRFYNKTTEESLGELSSGEWVEKDGVMHIVFQSNFLTQDVGVEIEHGRS